MSILFYRRPDFVPRPDGPLDAQACQRIVAKNYANKHSLPESVSFDKIIQGQTLSPCSLSDFLDYLVYVAHDAENLQFFLFYQDYVKRFESLSDAAQALSPDVDQLRRNPSQPDTDDITIQRTPSYLDTGTITNQPFREEVQRIYSHYLSAGAPRELNVSSRDRDAVFEALKYTTHPSIFFNVISLVETTLRNQLHPNFVRWTICNGNKPKVILVRTMASLFMTIGITLSVVLTLSHYARWWRLFVFIPFFMSIMNFTAAYKGLCIMLHFTGNKREIRPWENLADFDEKIVRDEETADIKLRNSISQNDTASKWLNTFGNRNEFEKEPWVDKWRSRPLIRKVWEPTTRVYNEGIRIMQDRIVKQSQLWGLTGSTTLTIIVTALPKGDLY